MCNLLHSKEKKIKVHDIPVQQQKNNTDGDIYAIAFAYFIADNTDPSIVSLGESKSRKPLYFCFQSSKWRPFHCHQGKNEKIKKKLYS